MEDEYRATPDEVADMVGVTVLMNGGSGTEDAPRAFVATREYAVDR